MNTQELPMILFTVIAQMSVGAFWALGTIHLCGLRKKIAPESVDRVTNAALFAVGPLLILGFIAAFFHLSDPLHAIYTLSHVGSSWLSRELLFGVLFGLLGFIFALAQWFGRLGRVAREVLAALAALAGLGLLVSMSGVYYSVRTIPAWNTFAVPVFFFSSAILTGTLAVALALLVVWNHFNRAAVLARAENPRDLHRKKNMTEKKIGQLLSSRLFGVHDGSSLDENLVALVRSSLQWLSIAAAAAGIIIFITYPLYVLQLAQGNQAAQHVAQELSASVLAWRLCLLGVAVLLAGTFAAVRARISMTPHAVLTAMLIAAFVLALVSELLGRSLHYEGLWHVGLNTLQVFAQ
ncbi:MAG: dimethyl sulfoxide reductase anchor subunit [Actinomycetaceae bacterium]|nr:dimethyl sulfoxide reductase anchor subunit [Arcanobacterium sp.]MDD7687035.1 dimethyl sulfoxide reductase anchor subunit [Actinomycetaceae bacterium]MDY5273308.1 DmsC/YnfH family molybdoenzyme membrane anchor subunit [Arcanobacterium sp.]